MAKNLSEITEWIIGHENQHREASKNMKELFSRVRALENKVIFAAGFSACFGAAMGSITTLVAIASFTKMM